jgi:alpha/beta superfamily hydrolase
LNILRLIFISMQTVLVACTSAPSPEFIGRWQGEATTTGERTQLILEIEQQRAFITLPDIGVARWPTTSLSGDDYSVEVVIPSDSGEQTLLLSLDEDRLTGTWEEKRFNELASVTLSAAAPAPALKEQRIQLEGPAGSLGVSYWVPDNCQPCSAVVFLHGSGPQPRDANRFAALALADRGVAAAIFDKRGVGESDGSFHGADFEALAADARVVADFIKQQPQVSQVGFYGHSQGGWIAPLAASSWPDAAFVITSAGPAVSPARETQWELVRGMRKAGLSEQDIEQARHIIELWHQGIRGGDWGVFDRAVAAVNETPWYEGLQYFRKRPSKGFIEGYSPIMDYNPLPVLETLEVPMLATLSREDESIDAMETASILQSLIASGSAIQIELYEGYDHTLRKLGRNGEILRWPNQPPGLYELQVRFIRSVTER